MVRKMRLKVYFRSRFKQQDGTFTLQYDISPFVDTNTDMSSYDRLEEMRRLKPRLKQMCEEVLGKDLVVFGSTDEHVLPLHHIVVEPWTDKKVLGKLMGWITLCDTEPVTL